MSDIMPFGGGNISPFSQQGRALARAAREVQAETALAALQTRGIEAVTELGMEALADLDAKRQQEGAGNQTVNQLCAELELIAARRIGRVVNNLYRESW